MEQMEQSETFPTETTHPRRRFWIRALVVVALVVLLPLCALWARLVVAPMALPDGMQARIEATINDAMTKGDVSVGEMRLALPQGGRAPEVEFRDVALTTPEGEVRARFPGLRVRVAPGPLIGGALRVRNVTVTDAGLNLRRGEDGRLDLGFAGTGPSEAEAADVSLADTLARLDRMFASSIFSELEEVRGEGMDVLLADATTGRDIRLHEATMVLERQNGQLGLSLGGRLDGSRDATLDIMLNRRAGGGQTDVAIVFDTLAARDLAASSPALAWLDLMRAPIDGTLTATMGDDGTLGAVDGQLQIGAGVVSLPGQDDPMPFNAMAAQLAYDPDTRRAELSDVRLSSDQLSFTARGHADVGPDGDIYVGQFTLADIAADPDGLFDAPLAIDGASVDLRLTLGEAVLAEVGQAVIYDDDLRATVNGTLRAAPDGVGLALDAHVSRVDVATVLSYWPRAAIPNTRWWVEERLLSGQVEGVDFALRQAPAQPATYEMSFDFTETDIRALPAAPPIRDASGFLNLQNTRLVVGIDSGIIAIPGQGDAVLGGSNMVIEDVSVRGPWAEFDLAISGQVPDVMHVLAGPPFDALAASGLTPEQIGAGQLSARVRVATRLMERDAEAGLGGLEINVDGEVVDFRASELVPDRTLAAERLTIRMTRDELAIGGRAVFDGVPVSGQWSVQIGPGSDPGSLVQARATLDRQSLARFGVAVPEWLMSGRGPADLTVFLRTNGPATMQVRSELAGIGLAIPPLAWRLPESATGVFSADIRLGSRPEVRQISLSGADLTLRGAISFADDGGLNRFSAEQFRVGDWLDVQGGLVARRGQSPAIEVSGGLLDFRFMPSLASTGGSSSGDIGPLNIALDRMQIADGIALTNLRADLDGATMSGDFRGLVNGAAAVSGQLVPGANGPSVRMQSDDGGAVLRAANIITNVHGGPFDLVLAARPEQGQYNGRLSIDSPRLRDAPVMAEILNLISVVGLLEQLGGDGINLGRVNAEFRVTPDQITVTEGAAIGPSMGISMDGIYDVASERYEMQGVVSPFYLVNGLFGAIFAPRDEGLFGFNYRVIGDPEDTRVSVNPLSLLTPGIFREIFRAPPPDFSQ